MYIIQHPKINIKRYASAYDLPCGFYATQNGEQEDTRRFAVPLCFLSFVICKRPKSLIFNYLEIGVFHTGGLRANTDISAYASVQSNVPVMRREIKHVVDIALNTASYEAYS